VRSIHRYGDLPSQFAELHAPDDAIAAAIAIVIHGGFWRDRYDLHLMDGLCADLAARGWAACNLEYRRVGADGGGWPMTFDDVRAGIDAITTLPALPVDRVVTIGHSAGGHLALWAAAAHGAVTDAVSLAGVTDLEDAWARGLSSDATGGFMGGSPFEVPERYAEASPVALLPIGVPMLLVHGDRDENVPVELSIAFAEAARAAGDDVELVVRPGIDHFEVIDPRGQSWARVMDWLA
jgi:dipeptidyl aminopeptidase/acylaminoacyl peptidase